MFSIFFCILQVIFQIVVFALDDKFDDWLNGSIDGGQSFSNGSDSNADCSDRERLCRFLGMQSLKEADHLNRVRIVLPDVIVFVASLVCFLNLRSIGKRCSHQGSQETQVCSSLCHMKLFFHALSKSKGTNKY